MKKSHLLIALAIVAAFALLFQLSRDWNQSGIEVETIQLEIAIMAVDNCNVKFYNYEPKNKFGGAVFGTSGTKFEGLMLNRHPATSAKGRWMQIKVKKGALRIKDLRDKTNPVILDPISNQKIINLDTLGPLTKEERLKQ